MSSNMRKQPPPTISSARVLSFAFNDSLVEFTDQLNLKVNGQRLGEVSSLAICREQHGESNFILVFCDEDWENRGVILVDSVADGKSLAEKSYKGIGERWIEVNLDDKDTSFDWPKHICSFCGKCSHDVLKMYSSDNSAICNECINLLSGFVREDLD